MEPREEQDEEFPGQIPPEGKERRGHKYTQKLESKLKEWTALIEKLRARAKVAEVDLKIKYSREVGNLEEKKEVLEKGLRELKKSSDEAWEAVKSGTEKAVSDFKQALEVALSKFKKSK
jgi:hypothetical protein